MIAPTRSSVVRFGEAMQVRLHHGDPLVGVLHDPKAPLDGSFADRGLW